MAGRSGAEMRAHARGHAQREVPLSSGRGGRGERGHGVKTHAGREKRGGESEMKSHRQPQ